MTATAVRPPAPPSFVRATSQLLAGSVVAQLLVASTFAYAARELGRPVFGLVVALLGVGAVGQDLLDFGTSQWLSRELAAGRISTTAARAALRRRAALTCAVCTVGVTAAVAARAPLAPALATGGYVAAAVGNAGAHARLRAAGLFRRAALHLVVERLAWLTLAIAVVAAKPDRATAAAGLVGAMALAYGGSTACAPRVTGRPAADRGVALGQLYRRSVSFGLLGLSSDLQQLDATASAALAGVGIAADVGIASKLTGPVGLVAASVSQVAFRGVARGGHEADRTARTALRLSGGLGLLVAAASPMLPFLAVVVLGRQYGHAGSAIIVYALGTAVAVLNQPLAGVLAARGQDGVASRIIAASVVIGLVLGSLLVRPLGAVGMGIGFALTQLLICACCTTVHLRSRP